MARFPKATLGVWRDKLDPLRQFTDAETAALAKAAAYIRPVRAGEVLIREGDRQKIAVLILQGFACRYTVLGSGDRRIISVLIPGDLCDGQSAILDQLDQSLGALTRGLAAFIPHSIVRELAGAGPALAQALRWDAAVEEAISRHWIVNGGRRAEARVAHLLCELAWRLDAVGLALKEIYLLPITQQDLGDATGLSAVHVNRVLRRLRDEGLIELKGGRMSIPDPAHLERLADFSPAYLHLRHPWTSRAVAQNSA